MGAGVVDEASAAVAADAADASGRAVGRVVRPYGSLPGSFMSCICCWSVLPLAVAAARTCARRSLAHSHSGSLSRTVVATGTLADVVIAASAAASAATSAAVSVTAVADAVTASDVASVAVSVTAVVDAVTVVEAAWAELMLTGAGVDVNWCWPELMQTQKHATKQTNASVLLNAHQCLL